MRLPRLAPADLNDKQRAVYDAIVESRNVQVPPDGGLPGPANAMLYSPVVGYALQELGAALRNKGDLPDRAREIAILVVATHCGSELEWISHEIKARKLGIATEQLDAIRTHQDPKLADPIESAILTVTRRLVEVGDLSDAEYDDAIGPIGPAWMFELSTLVGYYSLLAMQLRVFRVPLPDVR